MVTPLNSDNMKGLVFSLAIPSMLAQLINVLYSVVDRMYIGNIPEYGEIALAGVGVCGPIVTMISAFAFLIGIGGSPLVSILLGADRREAAEHVLANCFILLCGISLIVTASLFFVRVPLLRAFGASDRLMPYAKSYFTIYLLGTVFALLTTGLNQLIICQGFAKEGMISVLIGAVINIILDPLFIFTFKLSVAGAAAATVISQLCSCIYVLHFLFSKKPTVRITFRGYQLETMLKIIRIGMTSFLIILFDNLMLIALNAVLQKHGGAERGDMLLTCNTILQSFMLVITMPLGGLTGGTQTILGYNLGAGRPDKILKAQKIIFVTAVAFCTIMFLLSQTLPEAFAYIFTKDPFYIEKTARLIRYYTLGVIPLALQYVIIDGFTGMGMVKYALPLSVFRKTVYFSSVFIIPMIRDIELVFLCEPLSDFIGPAVSMTIYLLSIKRLIYRPAAVIKH